MDRLKFVKILMEQGRKISADLDSELNLNKKATARTMELLEDLAHVNELMERNFKLYINENCNNMMAMLQSTTVMNDIQGYFQEIGWALKEPEDPKQSSKSRDEQGNAMLAQMLMGSLLRMK